MPDNRYKKMTRESALNEWLTLPLKEFKIFKTI